MNAEQNTAHGGDFQLTTTPPRLGENSVPRINDVNDALEGSISYQEEEQRQQDHQQQQAQDNGGTETMCDVCKDFCCDVYCCPHPYSYPSGTCMCERLLCLELCNGWCNCCFWCCDDDDSGCNCMDCCDEKCFDICCND